VIEYSAEVTVTITDEYNMCQATQATVRVEFATNGDPRELLTRLALEKAVEAADAAERFFA
jgi:hypothetical protein